MKLKIRKGDLVTVISGSHKGSKPAKVLSIDSAKLQVVIEGVNLRKKHVKPSQQNPQGGVISKECPVHYSNVALVDSKGKAARIRIQKEEVKGRLVRKRLAKSDGKEIRA